MDEKNQLWIDLSQLHDYDIVEMQCMNVNLLDCDTAIRIGMSETERREG
jgi:hypothetical protein